MRPPKLPGGDLECAVLAAVWDLKEASARAIHDRVGADAGLVYTTIAKVLDRLHAKRLVTRERVGKAFIYRPGVAREIVDRAHATASLRRLLGDDPQPAIAALVDAVETLDPDLLDELGRAVSRRRRSRDGS